jgi:hypothetical protein
VPRSQLRRIASEGLGAFPPAALSHAADAARDFCWASGDVRFCVLSDLLLVLDELWEGPVESALVDQIDRILAEELPAILHHADPDTGRVLALACRTRVIALISLPL